MRQCYRRGLPAQEPLGEPGAGSAKPQMRQNNMPGQQMDRMIVRAGELQGESPERRADETDHRPGQGEADRSSLSEPIQGNSGRGQADEQDVQAASNTGSREPFAH